MMHFQCNCDKTEQHPKQNGGKNFLKLFFTSFAQYKFSKDLRRLDWTWRVKNVLKFFLPKLQFEDICKSDENFAEFCRFEKLAKSLQNLCERKATNTQVYAKHSRVAELVGH